MKRVLFICTKTVLTAKWPRLWSIKIWRDGLRLFRHRASFVNPLAISVMKELGVDISQKRSKGLEELSARSSITLSPSAARR